MSEHLPHRDTERRNQVLRAMASGGWANEVCGDLDSPTGVFSRVSNSERELHEVALAFEEEIRTTGADPRSLVGHFLVTEHLAAHEVQEYLSEFCLRTAYRGLKRQYEGWLRQHGGGVA